MRWRIATLLLSIAVLAMVVAFSRDVSVPMPPADGQVRAGLPFVQVDPGGAVLVCVSSQAGSILPPFLGHPYVPVAVITPLPSSNYTPPAAWGGS